jgi:hypothetical protein
MARWQHTPSQNLTALLRAARRLDQPQSHLCSRPHNVQTEAHDSLGPRRPYRPGNARRAKARAGGHLALDRGPGQPSTGAALQRIGGQSQLLHFSSRTVAAGASQGRAARRKGCHKAKPKTLNQFKIPFVRLYCVRPLLRVPGVFHLAIVRPQSSSLVPGPLGQLGRGTLTCGIPLSSRDAGGRVHPQRARSGDRLH